MRVAPWCTIAREQILRSLQNWPAGQIATKRWNLLKLFAHWLDTQIHLWDQNSPKSPMWCKWMKEHSFDLSNPIQSLEAPTRHWLIFFLGPRGPLIEPLIPVCPSLPVRKKNPDHLDSIINHRRTTVNLSNYKFSESWLRKLSTGPQWRHLQMCTQRQIWR